MIKKLLVAIMIALPMCVAAQAPKFGIVNGSAVLETMPDYATAQAPKFGIVNGSAVLETMPDYATAQTELANASKSLEAEHENLMNEYKNKYSAYQNLAADTPDAIKQRRIQEIQEFEQKIQQFLATAQQDLQRQQEKLMAPIQQKIQTAIQAVGSENGFTFIFPDAMPSFVGADVQDVTPLVKAKLGIQ